MNLSDDQKYLVIGAMIILLIVFFWIASRGMRNAQKEAEEERARPPKTDSNEITSPFITPTKLSSSDEKLDYICQTLNHIRWIGLGIGGMFAITFVIPQCSGW